jgi:GT2 family glycosyltransferase
MLTQQTLLPSVVVVSATEDSDLGPHPTARLEVDVILGSPGTSIQRNRALDRLQGRCDTVFFFDDDFVPSPYWIERAVRILDSDPTIAGVSGCIIRDGALSEAVSWEDADDWILNVDVPEADAVLTEAPDLYGCNMAFRMTSIRDVVRFDERLVLYGWLEDKDFSRRAGRSGRLVQSTSLLGVHLGIKHGRVSGRRFGYSQIANPWYLYHKGTLSAKEAWANTLKALAANGLKAMRPEDFIDRWGRFKGNILAVRHLLSGVCRPENAADL